MRIEVDGLALARGGRPLFRGLSFTAARGEAVAITGANGAGKTSLLRTIAGLLRPAQGVVRFAPGGEPPPMHLLGHHDGLKTGRTVAEELRFWTRWFGGKDAAADDALTQLDLRRLADLEVRRLSAGQRRRLALARLAAAPRPVWLLDEPMAPLDAHWRVRVGEIMRAHLADGGLILAAVHDPLPIPCRAVEIGAA